MTLSGFLNIHPSLLMFKSSKPQTTNHKRLIVFIFLTLGAELVLSTSSQAFTITKLESPPPEQVPGNVTLGFVTMQLFGNTAIIKGSYPNPLNHFPFKGLWSMDLDKGLPSLVKLVDSQTPFPQGIGSFGDSTKDVLDIFSSTQIAVNGDNVFFSITDGLSGQSGIYSVPISGGSISIHFNQSTQKPGAAPGTFLGVLSFNSLNVNGDEILVGTIGKGSYKFNTATGTLSPLFNQEACRITTTTAPLYSMNNNLLTLLATSGSPYFSSNAIVAGSYSDMANSDPTCFNLTYPYVIASEKDIVPGTESNPRTFDQDSNLVNNPYFGVPKIEAGTVVFSGAAKPISIPGVVGNNHDIWGLYSSTIGPDRKIRKLVDTQTPVPGGAGNFLPRSFEYTKFLMSGDNVVFVGYAIDPSHPIYTEVGVYLVSKNGGSVTKIASNTDTGEMSRAYLVSFSGNRLIYSFSTQSGGIFSGESTTYIATLDDSVGIGGNTSGNGGTGGNGGGTSSGTTPIIGQTESADQVSVNQPFSYTVSFTNNAPSVATSVKLTDTLPKKATLISAITSLGKKCKGKAPVICSFGTVAYGAEVTATITVTRKQPGAVNNSAVITYQMVTAGTKKKKNYKLVSSESTTVN